MNKLEQAMDDHKKGNWDDADLAYEEIISEEPENSDVMYLLAISKMTQNKLEESLKIIEKAIELNTTAPSFLQLKGSILARLGRGEEAIETLEIALEENPNLYQSHISIGHLYYLKGESDKAEKHFKSALKIDEVKTEAQANLARLWIDEGKTENALGVLKEIEKKHPDQGSIKMLMAEAYFESGAYSFAENYYQKVLAMHPENDLAGLYLGIAKIKTGDMETAERLINAYNNQYENTREGTAALGLLMYEKNHVRVAAEQMRRALSVGVAPLSWKQVFVESMAKLGQPDAAIKFYTENKTSLIQKTRVYRLGELYELKGNTKKAKQKYKKIEEKNSKYIASLLGLVRCYLVENKFEKAEKKAKKILAIRPEHAEGTLLYLTSLLKQEKTEKVLVKLEEMNYEKYTDVYKKTFRLQHGLILDNLKKYEKAIKVFKDKSKQEQQQVINVEILTKEEQQKIKELVPAKPADELKEPVFVMGMQSTGINEFVNWLHKEGVTVLNDRLVSLGRPDVLYARQDVIKMTELEEAVVKNERYKYHTIANALTKGSPQNDLFVDCMYLNFNQLATIKKVFSQAKIVLLKRDEQDIELNQEIFGLEPVKSEQWNEMCEQINSMELNIIEIDIDKWLNNDKETHKILSELFETEFSNNKVLEQNYWRKSILPKGHWKNYKGLIG